MSALGYAELTATCGTRPVHPVISCEYPVVVTLRGRSVTVPAGERYRVVGLTLLPGENELLLQMFSYEQATWADLSGMTWAELSGRRWGDLWVTDEPVTPEGGLPGSPEVKGLSLVLNGQTIDFGAFISAVISFLITAVAVFAIIKGMNTFNDLKEMAIKKAGLAKQAEEEAAPAPRTCPFCKQEIADDATRCPHCTSKLEGYENAAE